MAGLLLIIISSAIYPFIDVIKKKATKVYRINIIFWGIAALSVPFYIVITIWQGIPKIDPSFWWIIAINTPLLVITNILLIRDEKIAPISTTLPLLSFTPVFLIFTSYIFLGELPNSYGVIGIFLIVLGALLLKGEDLRKGLLYRMKDIFSHRSSLYILLIAFIWSFSATFAKMGIQASTVWFFIAITVFLEAITMSIWMGIKHRHHYKEIIKGHIWLLVLGALLSVVADVLFLMGLENSFVAYAIAIKRAFLIVGSIVLGSYFFREKNIKYRIGGALVMVLGIAFILVFGQILQ